MQHIPLDQQYPRLPSTPHDYHPDNIPLDIYAIDPIKKSTHQNTRAINEKNFLFINRTTTIRAHLYSPGHPNIPILTMTWTNKFNQKINPDNGISGTPHNSTNITLAISEPLPLHNIFDLQSTVHIAPQSTQNTQDIPPQHFLFHYPTTDHNIPQNGQELIAILRHAWKKSWYQPEHYLLVHALHHALYYAAIEAFHTQPRHCQYNQYDREHSIYQCIYDSIGGYIHMNVSLPNPPYPQKPSPQIRVTIFVPPQIAKYIPPNFHHINHTHTIPTNIHTHQHISQYAHNGIILQNKIPRTITQHENIQYQRQRQKMEQVLNQHPLHMREIRYTT